MKEDGIDLCKIQKYLATLNTNYIQGCYYERNRYMVDHSSRLICYYNGSGGGTGYTVNYAEKNNLQTTNVYEKTE